MGSRWESQDPWRNQKWCAVYPPTLDTRETRVVVRVGLVQLAYPSVGVPLRPSRFLRWREEPYI